MAELKLTKTVKFGKYAAELKQPPFPAGEFHGTFTAITQTELATGDFATDTLPLLPFVESWTVDGDPAKLESWRSLDYIREYATLRNAILEIVNAEFDRAEEESDLKN